MVLVFNCYVTNYHRYIALKEKQNFFLCPSFHRSGNQVWCSGSHNSTISVLARLCSFLKSGVLFLAHIIVDRFQFIVTVGQTEVPIFLWLSTKDYCHLLKLPFFWSSHLVTKWQLQGQLKNLSSSWLMQSLIQGNIIKGVTLHPLWYIILASSKSQFLPSTRVSDYTRARFTVGHLRVCQIGGKDLQM